ncbi:MAG: hypothetical protein K2Y39_18375, partial [Candidatus Obscuribacterales bacterium]|nr:hypothetical protein [Candidatus Obscuribacterales bacterium]
LDPQFYMPHADHSRLCSHDYWPANYQTGAFFQSPALAQLIAKLHEQNIHLGCRDFILPGILAERIDDDWLEIQRLILEEARSLDSKLDLYSTIALSSDCLRDDQQVAELIESANEWKAPGYYLVCEHPKGTYFVDDSVWVANVLDLIAGLRMSGSKVIVGYCNQQMLTAALAKANAICSGTWMNVRFFSGEKFWQAYDEEVRQRSTWYYCPQALSEYKIHFLGSASKLNVLSIMAPDAIYDDQYVATLFQDARGVSVGITEQASFRHYLSCLHKQVKLADASSFDDAVILHAARLQTAKGLLSQLSQKGIKGQNRDYSEIIDVDEVAIEVFKSTRGPTLRRQWSQL